MNIRECDMEFNLVSSCNPGDLLIKCDKGTAYACMCGQGYIVWFSVGCVCVCL